MVPHSDRYSVLAGGLVHGVVGGFDEGFLETCRRGEAFEQTHVGYTSVLVDENGDPDRSFCTGLSGGLGVFG